MKTLLQLLTKRYASAGLVSLGLLLASCSASKQTASSDGIYGDQGKQAKTETASAGNGYKEYFQSLREDEVFTDVEQYTTVNDSAARNQGYAAGNAGWGSESDQVVVNVYGSNWGYNYWNNYWYSPYWATSWGWNWGWGYNSWYGPYGGWGGWYSPYWGGAWGYGNPYYGNGYAYGNQYSYNPGIRGGRGENYGSGNRNSLSRNSTPSRARQATYANTGGRNTIYSNTSGRSGRTYTTTSTRQYTPGRSNSSSRGFSPVYSNSGRSNSTYTPGTSRSGSSSPSYSTGRSSSGSSYGGGGGGRSSGGGGGGGRSGGGGGGRR